MPIPTPADPLQIWETFALLCFELLLEPSSHLFATVAGWQYPTTRENLTLLNIIDMLAGEGSKTQPRPWDTSEPTGAPLASSVNDLLTKLSNPN